MKPFKFFNTNHITNTDDIRDFLMSEVPDYIIACGEIGAYREGVDAGVGNNRNCPYTDELRSEIWNRGYYTGNYANTLR